MNSMVTKFTESLRKRALYSRTVSELSKLPAGTAADLGITPADVRRLAHNAVYGN